MRRVACRRRPEPLASSRPQLELASLFADRSQPLVATQAAPAATTAGANTAFAENGIRLELLCEKPRYLEPTGNAARN